MGMKLAFLWSRRFDKLAEDAVHSSKLVTKASIALSRSFCSVSANTLDIRKTTKCPVMMVDNFNGNWLVYSESNFKFVIMVCSCCSGACKTIAASSFTKRSSRSCSSFVPVNFFNATLA